jgi:hypothetical protein
MPYRDHDAKRLMDAGLVEMTFSFGVVLALALWELYRTPNPSRSDKKKRDQDSASPPDEPPAS